MDVDPPLAAAAAPPNQRLMIREMVLENFKSYAGEQRVGPFHKVRGFTRCPPSRTLRRAALPGPCCCSHRGHATPFAHSPSQLLWALMAAGSPTLSTRCSSSLEDEQSRCGVVDWRSTTQQQQPLEHLECSILANGGSIYHHKEYSESQGPWGLSGPSPQPLQACGRMARDGLMGDSALALLKLVTTRTLSSLSQLRFNKVSELIHNSQNHRNLESARVTVYFQEIIDQVGRRHG